MDDTIIEPKVEHISSGGHALFVTRVGPLDVLCSIEEGKSYYDLIDHTVEIEFRGHIIRVLNLETLVQLKKSSKNPIDTRQLPILEEALRQLKHESD